jgi:C4-type Zn-finger protein
MSDTNSIKEKEIECPLCGEKHKVMLDKNERPYTKCEKWKMNVWYRGKGEEYLEKSIEIEKKIKTPKVKEKVEKEEELF